MNFFVIQQIYKNSFPGSESPIVVVLSGSMEPAFHRGDLLFLTNYEQEDIRVGEIVVFKVSFHFDKSYMYVCTVYVHTDIHIPIFTT